MTRPTFKYTYVRQSFTAAWHTGRIWRKVKTKVQGTAAWEKPDASQFQLNPYSAGYVPVVDTPVPVFDLNFYAATYVGDTLGNMVTEAGNFVGGLYEIEATGLTQSVNANNPQVTANGLEVWPSRRTRVLQNRNLTSGTWTLNGLTAARSTGRNNAANAGSRITVVSNGGIATQAAVTLAISDQTAGLDIKRVSGTGGVDVSIDGQATWQPLSGLSVSWSRPISPTQNLANPQFAVRFATAGDVFDLDFIHMETGSFIGPRVDTTTASVLVPQNRLTILGKPPIVNFLKTAAFAVVWEGKVDANGGRGLVVSDANFDCIVGANGSISFGTATAPAGTFQFGVYQKVAFSRDAAGNSAICVNGGTVYTGTSITTAALTHFDFGTNGAGVYNIRGIIRRVRFYASLTQAYMKSLST